MRVCARNGPSYFDEARSAWQKICEVSRLSFNRLAASEKNALGGHVKLSTFD